MPPRLVAAVAATLVVAAAAVPAPAAHTAAPACSAGTTLYAKGGARLFRVESEEAVFGCRRGSRRATLLVYDDLTYGSFLLLEPVGSVVPFLEVTSGEGGGYASEFGWYDTRTGRSALADPFLGETDLRIQDVFVARDGTTAVVSREDGGDSVVSVHRVRGRRGRMEDGRGLAFVQGRYVKRSLRIDGAVIRWRDGAGARAVPRRGEPLACTAGRTKLSVGPVRLFEVIDPRRNRGALHWCGPGSSGPRPLPGPRAPYSQLRQAVTASAPAGGRVAFSGEALAGVVDPGAGTVRSVGGVTDFAGVTAGPAGELVAAYDTPNGRIEGGILVARPSPVAFALEQPRLVATYRGKLDPGSLAVDGDTVTWRTSEGPRSVPLAGETTAHCAAGTTLSRKHGARVFELLRVADGKRDLHVCPAGAPGPLTLLTQAIETPFAHWFVGIRDGRGALVRWADRQDDPDTVFVFGTTQDSVRKGRIPSDGGWLPIRDLAIGPDGAVALVVDRYGGEIEIRYMAPTATGLADARRLATRKGGYRRNSLAVTETEIRWKTKRGATRRIRRP